MDLWYFCYLYSILRTQQAFWSLIFLAVYEAMGIFTKYFVDTFLTLFPEQTYNTTTEKNRYIESKKVIIFRNKKNIIFFPYKGGWREFSICKKRCIFNVVSYFEFSSRKGHIFHNVKYADVRVKIINVYSLVFFFKYKKYL